MSELKKGKTWENHAIPQLASGLVILALITTDIQENIQVLWEIDL